MFSHPLSYYSFKYFPKVNRTEEELMRAFDAYGMSCEDSISTFVRSIYADRGNLSLKEINLVLMLMACILILI